MTNNIHKKQALILMTRIPVANKTKTRLISKYLDAEKVAQLHLCFLKDIHDTLLQVLDYFDIYINYGDEGDCSILSDIFSYNVEYIAQQGSDLGQRQAKIIEDLTRLGYKKIIVIGSDLPHIRHKQLIDCLDYLDNNDLLLGPSPDGGYYLLALTDRVYKQICDILGNKNIHWGTGSVITEFQERLNLKQGLKILGTMQDIDTLDDLKNIMNYCKKNALCKHSLKFCSAFLGALID